MMRKTVLTIVLAMLLGALVPAAEARPVCTYETPYVVGVDAGAKAYSCNKVFDAILVTAGNAAADSNIEVCLKTSGGSTLQCRSGCGYVVFTGLGSNVGFITVKLGDVTLGNPSCSPVAGTIMVQFGDTRDGGGF